ncbi:MAG: MFS transporter [Sandaracinaceae bacterium]|nr:MFS transporter [Sandaracinaceae bacterium]
MGEDREFPRRLVAALVMSSMLTPLNSTMLSVVLGPIGREFRQPDGMLTHVLVTSYLITSIVMQAPAGKLGDRLGHRTTLAYGQVAFLLGSVAAFFAPTFALLGLARVIMATGGALIVPSATALLRIELPPQKRGQAFGAFGAAMALSAALGPVIGGFITANVSWRATFLVNLLVLPIAAQLARSPRANGSDPKPTLRGFRFDGVGSLLLGASLAAIVVGTRLDGVLRVVTMGGGVALGVAFGLWEQRHPEPVVDLHLLTRKVFVAGGLIVALHNLAMYALLFELPSALDKVLGLGTQHSGPLLGALMVSMVVASPIAGRLSDRLGARLVAVTGCSVALAGIGSLVFVPLETARSAIPGLVLLGLGIGLSSSPAQASAMSAIPAEQSGVGAALLATLRYLGGIAGIIVLGFVWSGSPLPDIALVEHQRTLHYFTVSLVLALGCAMVLPKHVPTQSAR